MRVLLLARHGQSLFNVDKIVNGDPGLDQGLSHLGTEEGKQLQRQIAAAAIDLCVTSEFPRAQQTAQLALGERADTIPTTVDADLNDVRIGELEGETLDAYREWKHAHTRADPYPGGESLDAAAYRYADAFERVLSRSEEIILCVCHEIPVRYAVNAAAGSDALDGPLHNVGNATLYVFDDAGLRRAVERIRKLAAPSVLEL
ncbi:MAG TPA: histidine phosphatase family protein [Gaiellaceae bacterium]|nr:histidine phosphatase family protein [Gaiellaceae bacterium]